MTYSRHVLACFFAVAGSVNSAIAESPAEAWLCTETASVKSGNVIKSCGVGEGRSESQARAAALENAKREFDGICKPSVDCRGHAVTVNPLRNTCSRHSDGHFVCFRGVEFQISEQIVVSNGDDVPTADDLAGLDAQIQAKEAGLRMKRLALEKKKKIQMLEQGLSDETGNPGDPQPLRRKHYVEINDVH